MANLAAEARTFLRGDVVLDYWLANAEGLRVAPGGGRVVEVVHAGGDGRPRSLVVRSRLTGRRRSVAATEVVAVQPWLGRLLLERHAPARRLRRAALWLGVVDRRLAAHAGAAWIWLAPRGQVAGRTAWRLTVTGARRSRPVAVRLAAQAASSARVAARHLRATTERGRLRIRGSA
jgi:hypothetical protein